MVIRKLMNTRLQKILCSEMGTERVAVSPSCLHCPDWFRHFIITALSDELSTSISH